MSTTLPKGWEWKKLGDVFDIQGGSQPDKSHFKYEPVDGYIQLLQIRDFGEKPVPTYVPKDKVTKFCTRNDVLIARYGASLGRIVTGMEGAYNVALAKVIFDKKQFYHRYVFYLLQTSLFQTPIHMISRSAQNGFNKGEVFPILLPVAPFDTQIDIVAEIEKQFSRLDEAVTALKRIQANLRRYKAAVLKAAVEGKLTEQWRKEHPDVEPADQLLKRILIERRSKWEAEELAKMKAKGITPRDDSWKKKYKEPAGPDTANLPDLPEEWVWTNFEQLAKASPNALKAGPFGSALKKEYYVSNGYKVYGQEQVISGDPFYGDYYIDQDRFDSLKSCAVKPGDILISLVGTIGKVLILPEGIEPGIINPRLVKLSLNKKNILPEFVKAYLQSDAVRNSFSTRSHGGTMDILNLSMLKELSVPLPPIIEQKLLIENIESAFSIAEELETTIETNLKRAERLRQTILQRAFSGGLV